MPKFPQLLNLDTNYVIGDDVISSYIVAEWGHIHMKAIRHYNISTHEGIVQ